MANTYRKALQEIFDILSSHTFQTIGAEDAFVIGKCHRAAEDALKEPPRNCDVGTAEEQEERQSRFCLAHQCGTNCPAWRAEGQAHNGCVLAWAQMPYEAQEGDCDA